MVQKNLPLINSSHGSETRNIINELIKLFNGMGYTYNEALQKAHDILNEAKQTNDMNKDVQTQINNLILSDGESDAEVIQARGPFDILKNRLDNIDENFADRSVNVMNPPPPFVKANGDGITDDTSILNTLFSFAKQERVPIFLPNKDYKINGILEIYSSVNMLGTFIMDKGGASSVKVKRTAVPIDIDSGSLSGLTRNSSKIEGIFEKGALLLSSSSEQIIERSQGGQYLKSEVSRVIDNIGTISPPLDQTYNTPDTLSVTLYPDEEPIKINGLNIKIDGSGESTRDHILGVERSDVTFNDTTIKVVGSSTINQAMRIQSSVGIEINNPKISGFENILSGYGISIYNSADIRINDGDIHECRHAISGTKGKLVRINGGKYSSNISSTIDSHWGNDFVVDGVTSTISNSAVNHITYAGADVEIRNSKFHGGINIFGIRNDTPELRGDLIMDNIKWVTFAGTIRVCGFTTSNTQNYNFSRTLLNPWNTKIKNIDIQAPPTTIVNVLYTASREYNQYHWGRIDIENINAINVAGLRVFVGEKYNDYFRDYSNTKINIKNIEDGTPSSQGVIISDRSTTEDTNKGFYIDIENYNGLFWSVAQSATKRTVVRNSEVSNFRWTTPTLGFDGDYVIENSLIKNTIFSGFMRINFKNCTFEGDITSNSIDINTRTISSHGNLAKIGCVGYPTNLDNYKDIAYFI